MCNIKTTTDTTPQQRSPCRRKSSLWALSPRGPDRVRPAVIVSNIAICTHVAVRPAYLTYLTYLTSTPASTVASGGAGGDTVGVMLVCTHGQKSTRRAVARIRYAIGSAARGLSAASVLPRCCARVSLTHAIHLSACRILLLKDELLRSLILCERQGGGPERVSSYTGSAACRLSPRARTHKGTVALPSTKVSLDLRVSDYSVSTPSTAR